MHQRHALPVITQCIAVFSSFRCSWLGTRNFSTTRLYWANKKVFESEQQDGQISLYFFRLVEAKNRKKTNLPFFAPTKRKKYKLSFLLQKWNQREIWGYIVSSDSSLSTTI
jgi:hypothetical protein